MEYLNHRSGIKRGLKTLLTSIMIFAIMFIILQGIFTLIPLGIGVWVIYKVIKFIKAKFYILKKEKTSKVESIDVSNDIFDFTNPGSIIDVEYEQVNK